ncbi:hypothetical protein LUX57_03965 [Actinomadura madurae]|nr:hypothetical protein [Actinomadura madurae]MCP9964423.1 hypothetical protein [Actinomadura madurae]
MGPRKYRSVAGSCASIPVACSACTMRCAVLTDSPSRCAISVGVCRAAPSKERSTATDRSTVCVPGLGW